MAKDYVLEKRKFVIAGTAICIVFIYIVRLFFLQISTDDYKKNADSNAFLNKIQYPSRGAMYDRNGKLLVFNQPAYDITIVPKEIENLGVTLTPAGEKDYMNNYIAGHLPNSLHDFRDVMLTFGIDNRLWRIIAYGKFIKDDAAASGVLKMYRGYFKLLSQKYGHAQEFYTPNVVNVDKTVTDARGKPQTVTEEKKQPISNPDFLKELQNGDAELYATFENGIVGAALGVNVDGNGQSYITIDYKNLKLMKEREAETLNAL